MMLHLSLVVTAAAPPPTVTLDSYGKLKGAWEPYGSVAAFRDIPFATAERFGPPQKAAAWEGVRDASSFGVGCAQRGSSRNPDVPTNRSEDCQRANVFAPRWPPATKLVPIMVWWHGGAYKEGSSYGPYNLYDGGHVALEGGVVVVSCNYRLEVLGALVHDGGLDGNQGFLDQRACLQWVQENAHSFGGDARNVTVWGQSAGAQSIWLHMASNGSANLFHRAILESAVDLSLFDSKQAAKLGKETAKLLGCKNKTDAEVIACLREAPLDDLLDAASKAEGSFLTIVESISLKHPTGSFLPFKPVIDGINFVEQPFETIQSGRAPNGVPAITGFNHDEMWALLDSLPSWFHGLEAELAVQILFGLTTGAKIWRHYKPLYPGDTTAAVVKILTDYLFTCSGQKAALSLPQPQYVYQYNHFDSFAPNIFTKFGLPQCAIDGRVCHMAEVPLVFNNSGPAELNATLSPSELSLSKTIIDAFTSFAKGGVPAAALGWRTFAAPNRSGLLINQTAVPGPMPSVCADLWDKTGYLH
jgi:carboxylesterase type B